MRYRDDAVPRVSQAGAERIVITGAGLAGLRTAEELRARGHLGAVTLVGAERRPPYDRPPLSKQLMLGQVADTTLRENLSGLEVDLRLGETATGLDLAGSGPGGPGGSGGPGRPGGPARVLHTDRGELSFDRLVLATGASPVALPGPGRQRFLRTLDDALALRGLLRPGLRLAIVGAGWIGAELATAAAAAGAAVTVVEAGPAPLATALGAEVGALTAGWYQAAGVDLRLGTAVASVEPGGLALAGGDWLAADEVVTAVGVRPETGWLAGSGVPLDAGGGVVVDEELRTAVPGVFAVGDCAAFWSPRYQARLRFEHWDVALRAPATVAMNLLGGSETYDPVLYFWSEQFGRMLQYAGRHAGADRLVLRGDPAAASWAACWLAAGSLVAVLAVNAPRDLAAGRRLIASGAAVDPARLADPSVALRDAAVG